MPAAQYLPAHGGGGGGGGRSRGGTRSEERRGSLPERKIYATGKNSRRPRVHVPAAQYLPAHTRGGGGGGAEARWPKESAVQRNTNSQKTAGRTEHSEAWVGWTMICDNRQRDSGQRRGVRTQRWQCARRLQFQIPNTTLPDTQYYNSRYPILQFTIPNTTLPDTQYYNLRYPILLPVSFLNSVLADCAFRSPRRVPLAATPCYSLSNGSLRQA